MTWDHVLWTAVSVILATGVGVLVSLGYVSPRLRFRALRRRMKIAGRLVGPTELDGRFESSKDVILVLSVYSTPYSIWWVRDGARLEEDRTVQPRRLRTPVESGDLLIDVPYGYNVTKDRMGVFRDRRVIQRRRLFVTHTDCSAQRATRKN